MIRRIIHKLKTINPWHFLWIGILSSIIFGLILNIVQSYLWWGFLSRDLLLIGIIDCFFVPLLIAPFIIYFVRHTAKLEELNKTLELEIIKVKESEKERGRETEALYRILFENAPVGIGIADVSGTLIAFNDAMLIPGGYTREDMATIKNVTALYYTIEERDKALAAFRKQGFLHQFPVQFKRRDGTPYDALLSLRPITYQGVQCAQAMVEDITGRKRTEQSLIESRKQLSLLASKLSLVEEKERRRIAKDLHDNIGQILACAKLKLGELNKSCDADCDAALRQIDGLVEQSIIYTRSLTAELSVPVLYEMGLGPAVAWLGREFQKNHSVQFHMEDDGLDKRLNDDARIVLFKAVRELLTNVAKHAHAQNVTVSLARKDGSMQVTVGDDGVGFDVADIQKGPRIQTCFGLFSIREAIKNSGGSVGIVSAPGRGTRITLTAPLEKEVLDFK